MENTSEAPERAGGVVLSCGVVDLAKGAIDYRDGTKGQLLAQELSLLRYLFGHPGRIVSRDELLREVWGLGSGDLETRTVDMHISKLRRKLKLNGAGDVLTTVRGQGYILQRLR